MQLAVDSNTSNYSLSKGEQIVKNMPEESVSSSSSSSSSSSIDFIYSIF